MTGQPGALGEFVGRRGFYARDTVDGRPGAPAGVWFAYGVGAVVGGVAALRWQPVAILLPLIVVAAVVVTVAVQ